jgi:UDP-N-acetylmuramoylalanine--D-glutamate ligase
MDLKGKKVTVVGLGRSGLAAVRLLLEKGARVSITDCQQTQQIQETARRLEHNTGIIEIQTGRHTEDLIAGRDLIVLSPGIPLDAEVVIWARKRAIPFIGEIELAFRFCPCPIIAITGTNGKTTVTTLLGEIFKDAGRKCVVCGNIGTAFSTEVLDLTQEHTVILEISSFQLESIDRFRPKAAVILNLSIDHLDRYASFEQYLEAKSRIFFNQRQDDWILLNGRDPHLRRLAVQTDAEVVYFSNNKDGPDDFNENQKAALAVSSLFAIPKELAVETCRGFKGIAHRLESLGEIGAVEFINDSKATNVDSTLWALNMINKPIILIAGGRDKGSDFSLLREKLKGKVRALVILGEAKEKIKKAFSGLVKIKTASTLSQAAEQAYALSRPGDCVLLSPMCASFDMFRDYAQRGEVFKQVIKDLV